MLADASLPRFVYWEGYGAGKKLANLHALPTNLPGDLLTFNLLTIPGAIRAGLGAVGLIAPPPAEPYEEVSLQPLPPWVASADCPLWAASQRECECVLFPCI